MAKNRTTKKGSRPEEHIRHAMNRYSPDPRSGLTKKQVREYRENGWDNYSVDPPAKTTSEIIRGNLLTYFNLIFLILSILLVIVGSFRDLTFLPVIIANTLIGIIQELRAKKTLEELSVLNAPKAKVIREGRVYNIPAERLVLDDIVIFGAGNQIPADAVVVEGEVSVNESLLTGEADEIRKRPGDQLMSGSFIVSGKCRARLDKVGPDSYISKLTIQAKATKEGEQSEMVRSLNHLVMVCGIIIIPIGITLFYQQYFQNQASLKDSVTSMVAAVIGMIPEGLFLLASVTLAVSTVKLALKKVLVHDMKCIETLARVDVLCVDKTGTITESDMKVSGYEVLPGYNEVRMLPIEELLSDFASAQSNDNITMEAMQAYFNTPGNRHAVAVTGFSSAHKYSSATFSTGAYVLGAPEFVLREDYPLYRDQIEEQSRKGYRVLVFCQYDGRPDGNALTGAVLPLALVMLANPIRKNAPQTFRFFADQGVDIKVISGDNPVTVSEVANQAGIAGADHFIDASTLKTQEEIDEAVLNYTVFGRVTPNQKRQFVRSLKKAGKTVAMTGDGVNDVLALKDADCSVAMASGSDAAAQASQLVLLESDFSRMPDVVMEGRQVVNNMERSGSLFLVKNIFSLLISLLSIWFGLSYPLKPSQISLISMFTIGIPAFFLSQVPNRNLIRGRFIGNILLKALPAGLTDAFVVGALVIFGEAFSVSSIDISTASTILLGIVGFMILYQISKPMDKYKWAIWFGCMGALLFSLIFLRNLFGITSMSVRCIMLFVMFSIVTEPVFRYLTRFFNFMTALFFRARRWFSRRKNGYGNPKKERKKRSGNSAVRRAVNAIRGLGPDSAEEAEEESGSRTSVESGSEQSKEGRKRSGAAGGTYRDSSSGSRAGGSRSSSSGSRAGGSRSSSSDGRTEGSRNRGRSPVPEADTNASGNMEAAASRRTYRFDTENAYEKEWEGADYETDSILVDKRPNRNPDLQTGQTAGTPGASSAEEVLSPDEVEVLPPDRSNYEEPYADEDAEFFDDYDEGEDD